MIDELYPLENYNTAKNNYMSDKNKLRVALGEKPLGDSKGNFFEINLPKDDFIIPDVETPTIPGVDSPTTAGVETPTISDLELSEIRIKYYNSFARMRRVAANNKIDYTKDEELVKNGYLDDEIDYTYEKQGLSQRDRENINRAGNYKVISYILLGIGAALTVSAIVTKICQAYYRNQAKNAYYNREFTKIPNMIVDEHDIVTYVKDDDGTERRSISFDQFSYYTAVRCNRSEVGDISGWQKGVDEYSAQGCGDVADLNADHGKEWLALYTVKSPKKGSPILADSLSLKTDDENPQTAGARRALHIFNETSPADLSDTAYCFKKEKGKMHFYWDEDIHAYE